MARENRRGSGRQDDGSRRSTRMATKARRSSRTGGWASTGEEQDETRRERTEHRVGAYLPDHLSGRCRFTGRTSPRLTA